MYRALTWWLLGHQVDIPVSAGGGGRAAPGGRSIEVDHRPGQPRDPRGRHRRDRADPDPRGVQRGQRGRLGTGRAAAPGRACSRTSSRSACAAGSGIVAEGRDIGTVVAPHAPVKVFLTASEDGPGPAAQRRPGRRLRRHARDVTRASRQRRDRADAPQMAHGAPTRCEIDSTALGLDEVISADRGLVRPAGARRVPLSGQRRRPAASTGLRPAGLAGRAGRPSRRPRTRPAPGRGRGRPAERRQVHAGQPDPRQPPGGRAGHPRGHQGPGRLRRHLARPVVHAGGHRRLGGLRRRRHRHRAARWPNWSPRRPGSRWRPRTRCCSSWTRWSASPTPTRPSPPCCAGPRKPVRAGGQQGGRRARRAGRRGAVVAGPGRAAPGQRAARAGQR